MMRDGADGGMVVVVATAKMFHQGKCRYTSCAVQEQGLHRAPRMAGRAVLVHAFVIVQESLKGWMIMMVDMVRVL